MAFEDEGRQKEIYQHILSGRLSSKEVEKMASISKTKKSSNTNKAKPAINQKFDSLAKNLGDTLKVPVLIQASDNGGKIVIKFATLQELNKIAKNIID